MFAYYKDKDLDEDTLKMQKSLPKGVTRKQYNDLLLVLDKIHNVYNV